MNTRISTRLVALLIAVVGFAAQGKATLVSYSPNPADMGDLDHHSVYTWRIDNINLNGGTITSASLTFKNIANWDSSANILHMWLLDTAKNAGVASYLDDKTNSANVTDMTDDFLNARYHNDPTWLVANGSAQTFLGDKSFTTTPTTYTLNFTPAELASLQQYISNGKDIALGLDPDCHFFNDGITFSMNITPVPEMSALFPIVGVLAAVGTTHLLRRRQLRFVSDRAR